jgi:hypothetical protein
MKYSEIALNPNPKSLATYFSVESKDGVYNLLANKTITIIGSQNANPGTYIVHVFSVNDQWTLLANRYYNDVSLWWVICKFNGISNPFIVPEIGTEIKIPVKSVVDLILSEIKA